MGKSIFDRNPITEMFSSVEEAMKCANSKELDGMLKNAFKGITSDPVLGKNNKSKQKMSVVIIADSDDSKLENKENMNYTRMQRYSAGGKKLRPIPVDNKGLQALAKKNPKLVMDMGFDPNSVAGKTEGKKKKGPKVPKNQNVVKPESTNTFVPVDPNAFPSTNPVITVEAAPRMSDRQFYDAFMAAKSREEAEKLIEEDKLLSTDIFGNPVGILDTKEMDIRGGGLGPFGIFDNPALMEMYNPVNYLFNYYPEGDKYDADVKDDMERVELITGYKRQQNGGLQSYRAGGMRPFVPKNQDNEGQDNEGQDEKPIPDTDVIGDDFSILNAARRLYYDYKMGEGDQSGQAEQLLRLHPITALASTGSDFLTTLMYPFLSEDEQEKIDNSRAIQAQSSQDLDDFEEQLEKDLREKGETMINFRDLRRTDIGTGGGKEGLVGKFKNLIGVKEDGGTGYAVPKQLNASYSSPLSAMGSALINQGANMQNNMGDQVNNGGELTEQTEDLNVAPVTNLAVGGQMFGQSAAGSFNPMGNMQGNTGNMPQKVRMMVQSMLSQVDMLKQKAASGEISETDLQEQASPLLAQVQEIINNYS